MMNEDLNEILNQAKDLLKDEMSEVSHKTWIEPLKIESITDNNVVLVSDEIFKRNFVDAKFHDLIMNTFSVLLQKNCTLSIICKDPNEEIEVLEIIIDLLTQLLLLLRNHQLQLIIHYFYMEEWGLVKLI